MTLQMALILIAIVVVAGVYFYSRWDGPRSGGKRLRDLASGKRDMNRPTRRNTYAEPTLGAAGSLNSDPGSANHPHPDDVAETGIPGDMQVDEEADRGSIEFSIVPELASTTPTTRIDPLDIPSDHGIPEEPEAPEADEKELPMANNMPEQSPGDDHPEPDGPPLLDLENDRVDQDMAETRDEDGEDIPVLESRIDRTGQAAYDDGLPQSEDESSGLFTDQGREPAPIELEMDEAVMIDGESVDSGLEPDDRDSGASASARPPAYIVNNGDQDTDLDGKPSIKELVGSMNPIQKLRGSIRHQLDIVKAEREGREPPAGKSTDSKKDRKKFGSGMKWWKSDRKKEKTPAADMRARDRELTPHAGPNPEPWNEEEALAPLDRDEPAFGEQTPEPDMELDTAPQPEPVTSNPVDLDLMPADGFDKLSQIDYYVKLNGDRDVSRESVLAIYREGAAELSKKHSIYGLRMPDKVWRDLENEPEESRFGDLVITLQLVDQEGPVNENDLTKFSSLVMKLSESTGRDYAFMAPVENAHKQALAIDQFRKRFDAIFVVNIVPMEGEELFEGPIIDRCATQIGLTADENGFYGRYKPMGRQRVCLYSLANFSDTGEFDMENLRAVRTRGVTFFTRPTINRSPGAVFSEMVDAARAFASRIKGDVIAPGFDDLSNEDVEKIRQSIDTVAKDMERYGINPGSDEAARLF